MVNSLMSCNISFEYGCKGHHDSKAGVQNHTCNNNPVLR